MSNFSTSSRIIFIACFALLMSIVIPIEESLSQRIKANYDPGKKFDIRIAGGWGSARMSRLNEFSRTFYAKEINSAYEFDGEFGYFLTPKTSVNVGLLYLESRRLEAESNVIIENGRDYSIDASMISPYYLIRYFFPMTNVDYYLAFGQGLCFGNADYYYEIPGGIRTYYFGGSYSAIGVGFLASAGAYYRIRHFFSLGAELGYRYLSTGDLENKEGETFSTISGDNNINLDFSGFYISGGISFRL